jgi:NADH dehydrogenase
MATIGRQAAVANVKWPFKAHWSGFLAWITWLTVHIYFLIGFRNRLAVMSQWIWSYITFNSGVRLIYGSQSLPGWTRGDGEDETPSSSAMDATAPGFHGSGSNPPPARPAAAD